MSTTKLAVQLTVQLAVQRRALLAVKLAVQCRALLAVQLAVQRRALLWPCKQDYFENDPLRQIRHDRTDEIQYLFSSKEVTKELLSQNEI